MPTPAHPAPSQARFSAVDDDALPPAPTLDALLWRVIDRLDADRAEPKAAQMAAALERIEARLERLERGLERSASEPKGPARIDRLALEVEALRGMVEAARDGLAEDAAAIRAEARRLDDTLRRAGGGGFSGAGHERASGATADRLEAALGRLDDAIGREEAAADIISDLGEALARAAAQALEAADAALARADAVRPLASEPGPIALDLDALASTVADKLAARQPSAALLEALPERVAAQTREAVAAPLAAIAPALGALSIGVSEFRGVRAGALEAARQGAAEGARQALAGGAVGLAPAPEAAPIDLDALAARVVGPLLSALERAEADRTRALGRAMAAALGG